MADREKRQRILQMVKDGVISLDEAQELLDALDAPQEEQALEPAAPKTPHKFLRVVVDSDGEDKARVRVNIPLSLAKSGLQLAQKFIPAEARASMEENNVSLDDIMEILEHLDDYEDGDIVNIDAAGDGDNAKVRIYLD